MDEGSTDSKIDDLLRFVSTLVQRQREEVGTARGRSLRTFNSHFTPPDANVIQQSTFESSRVVSVGVNRL